MANLNSSTVATSSARPQALQLPCHKQYSWLTDGAAKNEEAKFAAQVYDVTRGAFVIATIMRQRVIDLGAIESGAGASVRTLLDESDTEALAALAEFSLASLRDLAEQRVEFFNDQATKGA